MVRQISIDPGDGNLIVFDVDEDGSLTLDCLHEYYPNANGLIYHERINETYVTKALSIKDGKIYTNPEVDLYKIHYSLSKKK